MTNPTPDPSVARAARLAEQLASDFYDDRLDLSARGVVTASAWSRMPEVECAERLRDSGASDRTVRLFLTFIAAVDRARNAMRLWNDGLALFQSCPKLFDPSVAAEMELVTLRKRLSESRVSQRHGPDSNAWSVIARSLAEGNNPVSRAVDCGVGDAKELLYALHTTFRGRPRFPQLQGPKIRAMWLRMLVAPGNATITNMHVIPVAVDVHVRRATENLGVAMTRGTSLDSWARAAIQDAWREAVAVGELPGPPGIAGTCAALDPALWILGKYGCSHCEKTGQLAPISRACAGCQFRP